MADVDLNDAIPVTRRGRNDGFPVVALDLTEGTDPCYASKYFEENPRQRPPIVIDLAPDGETHASLVSYLISRQQNPFDVRVACRFLWTTLGEFRSTLGEEWASHGIQIGGLQAEIPPQNLLEKRDGPTGVAVAGGAGDATQWLWVLSLVLSPIRLQTGLRREYLDQLATKYKNVAEELYDQRLGDNYLAFAIMHSAWEQNTNYMQMAAAMDMFLSRFPDHPLSKVRFFTVSTRYRDCAASR